MRRSDIAPPGNLKSDLPPGWIPCTLGELGLYRNGRGFKKAEWAESGRPIIRIQNLTGSGDTFNYFRGETAPEHVVRDGDLLVSWAATLGVYFWRGSEAVLNQHIFRVDSFINRRFHALQIKGLIDDLYRRAHGSGMVHVTRGEFDGTPLLLPPEAEQQRIVDEVEKQFTRLDAAVAGLQRVKANLKRYRASVLKAACEGRLVPTEAELARREGRSFESGEELLKRILKEHRARWEADQLARMRAAGKGPRDDGWKGKYSQPASPESRSAAALPAGWTVASLDELSERLTSGSRDWSQFYGRGQGTFVLAQNVRPGRLDMSFRQAVDAPASDPSTERSRIRVGDLLLTIVGANTGDVCGVRQEIRNHFVCQSVALVRPVLIETSPFVEWFLVSQEHGQKQFRAFTYGQGRPHLGFEQIAATLIALPPLPEQHRIVAEVERRLSVVDELEATIEKNLARCARLRQSILKMAFEGRLVPQDPTDEPAGVLLERIRAGWQAGSTLGQ